MLNAFEKIIMPLGASMTRKTTTAAVVTGAVTTSNSNVTLPAGTMMLEGTAPANESFSDEIERFHPDDGSGAVSVPVHVADIPPTTGDGEQLNPDITG